MARGCAVHSYVIRMRYVGCSLAVLTSLRLLTACSGEGEGEGDPGEDGGGGGPVPSTIVGFSPVDLTTDVDAAAELTVLLTNAGASLPPLEELEEVVELVSVEGTAVAGEVTSGPSTEVHAAELRFRAAEPLADGWYELRFTDRFEEQFRVDDRVAAELQPSVFVARLRVGSQPFLRAVVLCLAGGERPPVLRLDFSEPVVSPAGEEVGVLNDDGSRACALAVEAASESPGLECRALDAAGEIVLEVPATLESHGGIALQRGPDGGAPPARYTVDAGTPGGTGCVRHPLVPAGSLEAATATR